MEGGVGALGRYIELLYWIFFQSSICPSICLFLAIKGRSGDNRFTVTFRLVFQLSICISVCLSVPLPQLGGGRELYIYIDILIILSIGNLYIYLSVPLTGRSRYIDISMIYILSKLRYWFFVMTRLYVMIGVCHSGDWCPSKQYVFNKILEIRWETIQRSTESPKRGWTKRRCY